MSNSIQTAATTVREEVANQEQLNPSVNEQANAPVVKQTKTKKVKKVKKPRDQWSNPRAGYPQQYLCAAISDSSRKLLPSMNDEELSQAQDALEVLKLMFDPFFTARSAEIAAARTERKARLEAIAQAEREAKEASDAKKLANAKLKELKAKKTTA